MARVNGQLVAIFDGLNNLINVAEIEAGVQTLGIHVQRQRHQIDIARALSMPLEERKERWQKMMDHLLVHDVTEWCNTFMDDLTHVPQEEDHAALAT